MDEEIKLNDDERAWFKQTFDKSREGIDQSANFMALIGLNDEIDPIQAMQIGYAILADKPIYVLAHRRARLPRNLLRVAHRVERDDMDNPEASAAAVKRLVQGE